MERLGLGKRRAFTEQSEKNAKRASAKANGAFTMNFRSGGGTPFFFADTITMPLLVAYPAIVLVTRHRGPEGARSSR
jgi:hypothetical protein